MARAPGVEAEHDDTNLSHQVSESVVVKQHGAYLSLNYVVRVEEETREM